MRVRLFGIAKDIAGYKTITVEADKAMHNVSDLKAWLSQRYPALQQLDSYAIAVDAEYADSDTLINNNSEIAVLPPVSGG